MKGLEYGAYSPYGQAGGYPYYGQGYGAYTNGVAVGSSSLPGLSPNGAGVPPGADGSGAGVGGGLGGGIAGVGGGGGNGGATVASSAPSSVASTNFATSTGTHYGQLPHTLTSASSSLSGEASLALLGKTYQTDVDSNVMDSSWKPIQ